MDAPEVEAATPSHDKHYFPRNRTPTSSPSMRINSHRRLTRPSADKNRKNSVSRASSTVPSTTSRAPVADISSSLHGRRHAPSIATITTSRAAVNLTRWALRAPYPIHNLPCRNAGISDRNIKQWKRPRMWRVRRLLRVQWFNSIPHLRLNDRLLIAVRVQAFLCK